MTIDQQGCGHPSNEIITTPEGAYCEACLKAGLELEEAGRQEELDEFREAERSVY